MAALATLPQETEQHIQDLTCTRKHNNKTDQNILIRFQTNLTEEDFDNDTTYKDLMREWIFEKLDILIPFNASFNCPYRILFSEFESDDGNVLECMIHFWHMGGPQDDGLIITDETTHAKTYSAIDILQLFDGEEPYFVNGIGVSAVSNTFAKRWWWEEINAGKGYMVHPMWIREAPYWKWSAIRESSFNFGWKNYPPTEEAKKESY